MAKKTDIEALISSQQVELDAVLLYKALADLCKNEEEKNTFLSMAADEGRHAAILKEYTGALLKPSDKLAKMAAAMYKNGGKKLLLRIMSEFEINSYFTYQKYFVNYPKIANIASDEVRHGHLLSDMI
mgnify:CR=1 FL=1